MGSVFHVRQFVGRARPGQAHAGEENAWAGHLSRVHAEEASRKGRKRRQGHPERLTLETADELRWTQMKASYLKRVRPSAAFTRKVKDVVNATASESASICVNLRLNCRSQAHLSSRAIAHWPLYQAFIPSSPSPMNGFQWPLVNDH
jgi:hypothetical protein